jgi:uncharacterized Zn-binding protein involved in type VI secretion
MRNLILSVAVSACVLAAGNVSAQQTEPTATAPGVITGGSDNVSVGDTLTEGSPNVFINGRRAVTTGDRTGCGGVTVGGASNVFINGKPVARSGDMTTGCAEK